MMSGKVSCLWFIAAFAISFGCNQKSIGSYDDGYGHPESDLCTNPESVCNDDDGYDYDSATTDADDTTTHIIYASLYIDITALNDDPVLKPTPEEVSQMLTKTTEYYNDYFQEKYGSQGFNKLELVHVNDFVWNDSSPIPSYTPYIAIIEYDAYVTFSQPEDPNQQIPTAEQVADAMEDCDTKDYQKNYINTITPKGIYNSEEYYSSNPETRTFVPRFPDGNNVKIDGDVATYYIDVIVVMDIKAVYATPLRGDQRLLNQKEVAQFLEKTTSYYDKFLADKYGESGYRSIKLNYVADDLWHDFSYLPFYEPYLILVEFEAVATFDQGNGDGLTPSIETLANTMEEVDAADYMKNYIHQIKPSLFNSFSTKAAIPSFQTF